MLLGLLLFACAVETLGVELPSGGVDAISHEDLRRDVYLLVEGPPAPRFAERLAQMQMLPADAPAPLPSGTTCLGRGAGATVLVAPWPADPDTATAAAALISVAKAWDLGGGPPQGAILCMLPEGSVSPPDTGGALFVGPLAAGAAVRQGSWFHADPADPARPAGRIVYTELQERVKVLFRGL